MLRRRPADAVLLLLVLALIAAVLVSVLVLRQAVAGDGFPLMPAVAVDPATSAGWRS